MGDIEVPTKRKFLHRGSVLKGAGNRHLFLYRVRVYACKASWGTLKKIEQIEWGGEYISSKNQSSSGEWGG